MKFCWRCGASLLYHDTERFNSETGVRITKGYCPSGRCEHEGNDHDYADIGGWFSSKQQCTKCNKIRYLDA